MSDFNNRWFEIFRAGDYGDKGKFTVADLQKMVANLSAWKPPFVLGHPETNSPAMGWAAEFKVEGDRLLARGEKVQPELEAHVASGRFPNRSIAIYVDPKGNGPTVRHIGFLGATPPEVKGLAPVQFSDGEFVAIEFSADSSGMPGLRHKEEEAMTENNGQLSKEHASLLTRFAERLQKLFGGDDGKPATFSEADMMAKVAEMKKEMAGKMEEGLAAIEAKFAEKSKKVDDAAAATAKTSALDKVKAFIAARTAANQWVPAFAEAKLDRVLEVLSTGGAVTFSEGDGEKKKDVTFGEAEAYAALTGFLEALPKIVPLGDVTGEAHRASNVIEMRFNETKDLKVDPESLALNTMAESIALELRKADPKLSEIDAFKIGMQRARSGAAARAGGASAGKA